MTDNRKLLESAAKAAGLIVHGLADKFVVQHNYGPDGLCVANDKGGYSLWNPLTDDGDALRLAVKLEIDLQHNWQSVIGIYTRNDSVKVGIPSHAEVGGDEYQDRLAATRRAIVRAAAEIGKAMEDQ